MLDRTPTKPNRYAVYDDAHNFIRYEYHERADEPTQAGDALNKANLLPDAVATALGLTGNPQVKDALTKLETIASLAQTTANGRAKIAIGSYTGTGTYGSGSPNSLTFPFEPQLVIIENSSGISFYAGNSANHQFLPIIALRNVSSHYEVQNRKFSWAANQLLGTPTIMMLSSTVAARYIAISRLGKGGSYENYSKRR